MSTVAVQSLLAALRALLLNFGTYVGAIISILMDQPVDKVPSPVSNGLDSLLQCELQNMQASNRLINAANNKWMR